MDARDVYRVARDVTFDVLRTLGRVLRSPSSAAQYCARINVPPITMGPEWAASIDHAGVDTDDATALAEALALVDEVRAAVDAIAGRGNAAITTEITRRLFLPLVLASLQAQAPSSTVAYVVYLILSFLLLLDRRALEAYPQSLTSERYLALFSDMALRAGWAKADPIDPEGEDRDADAAVIASDAIGAALGLLNVFYLASPDWFRPVEILVRAGFDHPTAALPPEARASLGHAVTTFLSLETATLEARHYQAFDPPRPTWAERPLAITVAPLPATNRRPDAADGHGGGLFLQLEWERGDEADLGGGWRLQMSGDGTVAVLLPIDADAPPPGAGPLLGFGATFELARDWPPAVSAPDDRGDRLRANFRADRLRLGARLATETTLSSYDALAYLRLERAELALGGPFPMRAVFDAGVRYSYQNGFAFEGGAGGEVALPIHVGGSRFGIDAQLRLRLELRTDEGVVETRVSMLVDATLRFSKFVTLHVDGIGAAFIAGSTDDLRGELAGIARLGWAFVPGAGFGLGISVRDIVSGGGHFAWHPDTDRLEGAIELAIGKRFRLTGLGIYEGGADASWLLVAAFEHIVRSPGFAPSGIGLLYGTNRRGDPDAMFAALGTGDLDAVLFPKDIAGRATQYLATLQRFFPRATGTSVIGVMVEVSGLGGELIIKLGVISELSEGDDPGFRFYLLARARLELPGEGLLQLDGVGYWDTRRNEGELRLTLASSKLWGGELTGEALAFHGDPDETGPHGKATWISIGGFHPEYAVPGDRIRVPKRVSLVVSKGDHLRFDITAYAAYAPGSLQFGVSSQLHARVAGFGIRGKLAFDALFSSDWRFAISVEASLAIELASRTLAGVSFRGTVTGPVPVVLSGKATISFLFFSWSKSFSLNVHEGAAKPATIAIGTVFETLGREVARIENWDGGTVEGVVLTSRPRAGLVLSPTAPIRMLQQAVPLGTPIDLFGSQRLAQPEAVTIDAVRIDGRPVATRPVTGEFMPGLFFDLPEEEKLTAPAFERLEAGFEIDAPLEAGAEVEGGLVCEEFVIDSTRPPRARRRAPMLELLAEAAWSLAPGASARFYAAPAEPVRIRPMVYAVVDAGLRPDPDAHAVPWTRARGRSRALRIVPAAETR